MKRLLITGLKVPIGGVEKAVLAYTSRFDPKTLQSDFVIFGNSFPYSKEITGCGGRIFYLPNRMKHPILYKRELKKIFSENSYDCVWCNFNGLTNIDFLKVAKLKDVPVRIAHSHTSSLPWGNRIMKYIVLFLHFKNKLTFHRYTTQLWACSQKSADFMFGKYSPEAVIIPNAVDTDVFKPDLNARKSVRKRFSIPENAPVFCHIGRMCKAKNQCFLLEVFHEILNILPNSKLFFVGDGELIEEINRKTAALNLENDVIFTGFCRDTEKFLQASDVFLLPSVTEGFPVTLTEAQAVSLPCVTSCEAVTRSADLTGKVAFVSLKRSPKEWAEIAKASFENQYDHGNSDVENAGYSISKAVEKIVNLLV